MGNTASSKTPEEDDVDAGDEELEDEEDAPEEEEEEGEEDVSEEQGFNMVFSPELVRRLQGRPDDEDDDDEDDDAEADDGVEAHLAESERLERERREHERLVYANLSRQEKVAAAELDSLINSVSTDGAKGDAQAGAQARRAAPVVFGGPCAKDEAACMECIRANGSLTECQDVINQFEACVREQSK